MNSQYMVMDVLTAVHIADTLSWSLITYILSTSLAAERSMSWWERAGDRDRNTEQERECVSEQGPAVSSMKGSTKLSILLVSVREPKPFVIHDHLQKMQMRHVATVMVPTCCLSSLTYWSQQIKHTDRLIKTHTIGFQQSRAVLKHSCHCTITSKREDIRQSINLIPH